MKRILILMIAAIMNYGPTALAIPNQINYQGYLTRPDGTPLDTTVAMTFAMYYEGNDIPMWTETQASVVVANGVFHALLGSSAPLSDSLFSGQRYLGVSIGSDLEMLPRLPIVSVAHAFRVGTVDGASGGTISGELAADAIYTDTLEFADGTLQVSAMDTSGLASRGWVQSMGYLSGNNNVVSGTGFVGGGSNNKARGDYAVIGGGGGEAIDSNSASGSCAVVGGGRRIRASGDRSAVVGGYLNSASDTLCFIGGGQLNVASRDYSAIGGGYANIASGLNSTVGGGRYNRARGYYSAVCGGGGSTHPDSNSAIGDWSSIGGGQHNVAIGEHAAIAGGWGNHAVGTVAVIAGGQTNNADSVYCTIGGGFDNTAAEYAATIAGGFSNHATGHYSTVGGGSVNSAEGLHATIPGGSYNRAAGSHSFAAGDSTNAVGRNSFALGTRIVCAAESSFVWSDGSGPVLSIGQSRSFNIKATSGTRIWTNSALTSGITIGAGGNAWVPVSDSTKKRNIRGLDTQEILAKFSSLPLKRWEYKSEEPGVEHIGPMAQDFWKTFHLGNEPLGISTVDADGVMMGAIQELAAQNEELRSQLNELREQFQSHLTGEQQTSHREN